MDLEANPGIFLSMHAMESITAGRIGSVEAVRTVLALLARRETTSLRMRIDGWTSTRSQVRIVFSRIEGGSANGKE